MIVSMIAALAATAQPGIPQPASAQSASAQPVCQSQGTVMAGGSLYKSDGSAKLQRLDQLPPADLVLTVLRTTGKCSTPVIVRHNIGSHAN